MMIQRTELFQPKTNPSLNSWRDLAAVRRMIRFLSALMLVFTSLLFSPVTVCSQDNSDGLFPALDDLPPLSGGRSGTGGDLRESRPLPPVDDDRPASPALRTPAPRSAVPRGSSDSRLDLPVTPEDMLRERLDDLTDPFGRGPSRSERGPGSGGSNRGVVDERERESLPTQEEDDDTFDWTLQPVSIADMEIGFDWQFEHGKPNLTVTEEDSYVRLVRAIMDRQTLAPGSLPETANVRSVWETAFYRFAEVRRQAWLNGKIRLQPRMVDDVDPFSRSSTRVLSATDNLFEQRELTRYSLQVDMQSNPEAFVGRPVVLYGLFTPIGPTELQARRTLEGDERVFTMQRGILKNLRNTQTLAMVDAISYVDPQSQNRPSTAWPVEKRVAIPVLIKGWFVKLWQQQPLIFTDVTRILTPRPYDEYVRDHVRSRRKVSDDESWIYHETLRQLQVTSSEVQAAIASEEQKLRVNQLLLEVEEKASTDRRVLDGQLKNGVIPKLDTAKTEGYETRRRRLERQVSLRRNRYLQHQQDPASFPLYVDVFQNPDRWQGRLVTLRGHVRRVTTYNGDSTLFDGQPLHELWLFTDDSQQNPAVIVTPSLPKDFPVSSDLVNSVSVTGCFFKMYVYRSQQENRLAPLVLAGHVSWNPAPEHVLALAKDGHLSATSARVTTARSQTRSVSDTMVLMIGVVALISAMTVWGRVQRDRREHRRLMSLVDERPDFRQTSADVFPGSFVDSRIEPNRG